VAQILEAARAQLRETGAAQLSLRAVAGALGMSPAGLYRYYDSREALLTALIAEAFDALADAVERGRDSASPGSASADDAAGSSASADGAPTDSASTDSAPTHADRLLAGLLAFRDWSVTHPQEFGLLYGDPIPGYAAPAGGPTSIASRRVGVAVLTPLVLAWRAGRVRVPASAATGAEPDPVTRAWAATLDPRMPPEAAAVVMGVWTRVHGLVVLEVFGHLRWLAPDTGPLARAQLRALVDDVLLP
jgi:AcrR family transcriptional regulator